MTNTYVFGSLTRKSVVSEMDVIARKGILDFYSIGDSNDLNVAIFKMCP